MKIKSMELNHALLSADETQALVSRYQQTGDQLAAERVLAHNEKLVYRVAKRYYDMRVVGDATLDDLMQEGRIGIFRALKDYDHSKGVKFSTYAYHWIRSYIGRNGKRQGQVITMSYNATTKRAEVGRARAAFEQTNRREPSTHELALITGLSPELLNAMRFYTVSIDANEDGVALEVEELSDQSVDVEEQVSDATDLYFANNLITHVDSLPKAWRSVIRMRYGLNGPRKSLKEIASTLHVSKERVRQIEIASLERMRGSLGLGSPQ